MEEPSLRPQDLEQIRARGSSTDEILRQIHLLRDPPPPTVLVRPAVPGDGIRQLSPPEIDACIDAHADASARGRVLRFTPASGAATRMFQDLLAARASGEPLMRPAWEARAATGDRSAAAVVAFMKGIRRFAFWPTLEASLARHGMRADDLADAGRFSEIVGALLDPEGLSYASLPKGLLEFHRYPEGSRTALEEQLVEAAQTARDREGRCRLHFTVSEAHLDKFVARLASVQAGYESRLGVHYSIDFSVQQPSTDTVAIDGQGQPFRDARGRLLFRPGGHGALIANLDALHADLIVIKNIDNVVPDHLREATVRWKKCLIGFAAATQQRVFRMLAGLHSVDERDRALGDALRFLKREMGLAPPAGLEQAGADARAAWAIRKLDRPLRVCGMVRSEGDPGGGPYWVRGADGEPSLQIVETAQVDREAPGQQAILASATHFNPVDLVCAVRDWRGRPFDLRRHVDPSTVFLARKSSDGRELLALELPGLWNGAMADWITLFVEVPPRTFTPVKTLNDLLRPEHQPDPEGAR